MRSGRWVVPVGLLVVVGCTVNDPPDRIDATVPGFDAGTDAGPGDAGYDAGHDAGPFDGGPSGCLEEEACGDGLDDDCDGRVDEGCGCAPGDRAPCFLAPGRFRNVGLCRDGEMVCEGFEFGEWGPCVGAVGPAPEVCDAAGLDEDCDGASNNGCGCAEGDPDLPCGTDVGACVAGVQRCIAGTRTACEGAVGPVSETCNGIDDDCDGSTDEGLVRACGLSVGACRMGTETCEGGRFGECRGAVAPSEEVCNGADDDCDGRVDEDARAICGTDVGACQAGTRACVGGMLEDCVGAIGPSAETCNDIDDDCDGRTDEDLVRACGSPVGACTVGTETCAAGAWGACAGSIPPRAETCDGTDDDCDGSVDEGCPCTAGTMRACGTSEGRCEPGTQACSAGGTWGACVDAILPRVETCDGTDDDCDGTVDEGCDCMLGATRPCGSMVGECRLGMQACDDEGQWAVCTGGAGPSPEICNGRDDDCDGAIDEGRVCPPRPPVVTCPGAQSGVVGATLALMGGATDPDGGPITYRWTVVTRPMGSFAAPTPSDAAVSSFVPDEAGTYTLQLCATDDTGLRACCTAQVTATPSCAVPPAAPTVTLCGTSWDRRPVVQFTPVPAGIEYRLFFEGTPYATVATAGHNYHRPASPLSAGAPPPGALSTIVARACRSADPACCSAGVSTQVRMVEECTTPIPPTPSNVVFSEYVIDGAPSEAGEAIEITNLSHCPVALDGNHFGYCNSTCASTSYRWMNFGAADVIPPRGVYVAIRDRSVSTCSFPFLGAESPALFGLRVSRLTMAGPNTISGWFVNNPNPPGRLRVATGEWVDILTGTTLAQVYPYSNLAPECSSIGFNASGDACGNIGAGAVPTQVLTPNQLGRLWHPCDAVSSPNPPGCM